MHQSQPSLYLYPEKSPAVQEKIGVGCILENGPEALSDQVGLPDLPGNRDRRRFLFRTLGNTGYQSENQNRKKLQYCPGRYYRTAKPR